MNERVTPSQILESFTSFLRNELRDVVLSSPIIASSDHRLKFVAFELEASTIDLSRSRKSFNELVVRPLAVAFASLLQKNRISCFCKLPSDPIRFIDHRDKILVRMVCLPSTKDFEYRFSMQASYI